ncbi:MAG: ComF family protein [Candidatus Omnitrophica bacterium]|nr:ComF family protein [Candidatus Omnitrophota bacterium]MCF7894565.1 ComF family protein [Candidatus Omnitrophota bacterium]
MLKKPINALKNTFFPPICLNCGKKTTKNYLCLSCKKQIKVLRPPFCYSQIKTNNNIYEKPITALSSCNYKNPIKNLIYSFKYKHCDYLADFLSRFIVKQLKITKFKPQNYDFIVPVPLHPYKMKIRGYNQAELLAKQIAKYFQLPLKNDIITSKYVKDSQTKLSSKKRQENVKGKFIVKENFTDKNILLIDDVFTTGATISTCWQSLKEKGVDKIFIITLAKALKN